LQLFFIVDMIFDHNYFMRKALCEAQVAFEKDEVPVGAVVVWNGSDLLDRLDDGLTNGDVSVGNGRIIARAHNMTEQLNDVTAHAEMLAFTAAANAIGGKYLQECTLYVTLEPCIMCAGAAFWTQIGSIVYGATDPKRGFSHLAGGILHPKTTVIGGILENECAELLKQFFKKKR
jgi:tRNA(adenine34) deaminase